MWGALVLAGVGFVLRLARTRWGWAAAVILSVVGTPRLLIYMFMTFFAVLTAPVVDAADRLGATPRVGRGASTDHRRVTRLLYGRRHGGTHGRRDMVALAALCLAGVAIPLWLSAAAGGIGLPSTDDWVYMGAAGSLFRSGSVEVAGHTAASIGQLVMVQPLLWLSGGNAWAFTAFGLVMPSIGVVCTYLLARRFVGTGSAVMVVLLVLASPGGLAKPRPS